MRSLRQLACLTLIFAALLTRTAQAAFINYGDFNLGASGISFLQVQESSGTDPVPLYGPPSPFQIGLDFNPLTFTAQGSNGSADITDGQLNFTVKGAVLPSGSASVSSISVYEAGDYTLAGVGGAATSALAGAIIRATVTEIDGVAVSPINLTPVNASVGFFLPANAGIVQPWSLGLLLDIDAQLAGLGLNPTIGATKVDVVINNTLVATSEAQSLSFIAKKDFRLDIESELSGVIPEPTALALVGFAGMMMLGRRNRAA